MKLTLQRNEDGKFCLFVDGQIAPSQTAVDLKSRADGINEVIVTFYSHPDWDDSVKVIGDLT